MTLPHKHNDLGITLLEILAALFIFSLTATIATVSLSKQLKKNRDDVTFEQMSKIINQTRLRAIKKNEIHTFKLNIDRKEFWNKDEIIYTLPDDVKIEAEVADLNVFQDPIIGFIFMPDGSSSAGEIKAHYNSSTYSYNVNWLTGRLKYAKDTTQ